MAAPRHRRGTAPARVEAVSIIGITGLAGSGKNEAARVLVEHFGFVEIALADEIKRICASVFGWGPARLWGPSHLRNMPDPDWGGLTARHALQQLGTEWGRNMHPDVWVRRALGNARRIETESVWYTPEGGIEPWFGREYPDQYRNVVIPYRNVVIPDVRFPNEVAVIHAVGGKVWRIERPGAGLAGSAGLHESEVHIGALTVDGMISNDRDLDDLQRTVVRFAEIAGFQRVKL